MRIVISFRALFSSLLDNLRNQIQRWISRLEGLLNLPQCNPFVVFVVSIPGYTKAYESSCSSENSVPHLVPCRASSVTIALRIYRERIDCGDASASVQCPSRQQYMLLPRGSSFLQGAKSPSPPGAP